MPGQRRMLWMRNNQNTSGPFHYVEIKKPAKLVQLYVEHDSGTDDIAREMSMWRQNEQQLLVGRLLRIVPAVPARVIHWHVREISGQNTRTLLTRPHKFSAPLMIPHCLPYRPTWFSACRWLSWAKGPNAHATWRKNRLVMHQLRCKKIWGCLVKLRL